MQAMPFKRMVAREPNLPRKATLEAIIGNMDDQNGMERTIIEIDLKILRSDGLVGRCNIKSTPCWQLVPI